MVHDILSGLEKMGNLSESFLLVADRQSLDGKKRLPGSLITEIRRGWIVFETGETGQEKVMIPSDKILEIRSGGRTLFRKSRRMEKVYPR